MKELVQLINISRKPFLKASSRVMTEIFTVSRLKYRPDLLPLKSVCPLPEWGKSFEANFEEIALNRAQQLWIASSSPDHLQVLWSGGIDSTAVIVALILTRPVNAKITILCNLNSLLENKEFYKKLLHYPFVEFKNSSVISTDHNRQIVTGELADQLFGSDLIFAISNSLGFEANFESYEKIIPQLFSNRAGTEHGLDLYEKYRPIVNEAPFKIKTAFDFVWWWNFTQKWQCIKFHQKSLLDQKLELIHFYEDDNFQRWSVFQHHLKIGKTLDSYKMPSKNFIFKFDQNEFYLKNKKKYASPLGNKRHYYALFEDGTKIENFDECYALIDKLSPGIPN